MINGHFVKIDKPVKSRVYDVYWQFAAKRFDVFLKRMVSTFGPWTSDPVISNHRFTNVFRATDRVSQYLIDLQYHETDSKEIIFKTLLFKIFNKIETYIYLLKELEEISYKTFSLKVYDTLLTKRMAEHKPVYSAAYIMPSAGVFGYTFKHTNHLALLEKMIKDNLFEKLLDCNGLECIYNLLLSYPSFGSFLAFQYTIDLNYSNVINFSEMDFVVAGPGAKNGILKCFDSLGQYSYEDVIKLMADSQERECARLEIDLPNLWGRNLQLIDCQNLFCETDKYLRATHPEVGGVNDRKRIKQKFSSSRGKISLFFPPKWNINDQIPVLCQETAIADIYL